MTRALQIALAVCCVAAVAAAGRAQATTGIDVVIPVKVTLTDKRVSFSHRLKPTTDTTIAVKVVNRSSHRRWFKVGYRKTHTLQRGGSEVFYYSFHVIGRTKWTAGAVGGGKTFRGSWQVKFAPYGASG